jgi:hypothetical protein
MRETQMVDMLVAKLAPAVKIRVIFLSVLLAPTVLAAQTPASLCDDDPGLALVFVGTLTEIRPEYSGKEWTSAVFHRTEPLQGRDWGDGVVIEIQNRRCKNQETTPRIGESYFIRTHMVIGPGSPVVGDCEQMRPASQASTEIEYFRRVKKGDTPTEVIWDTRADPLGYPWKRVPVPGTTIHALSGGKKWDFVSDPNGFIRAAISPGQYDVAVQFPTGYEPYYPPNHLPRELIIGHLKSCAPSEFTVMEHLCTTVVLCGEPTGSIGTRVVDVNEGPLDLPVQLTLETAKDQDFVRSVYTEENGHLQADRLLPGKYILGLSTYAPMLEDQPPYPPTYYPGVSRRSEAQVITLRAGEHKMLPDMRIKKGTACQIPVQVIDELGHPSPDTDIGFAYPDYPNFWIKDNPTEKDGRGKVYAVFPGTVSLRAEKPDKDKSTVESDVTELTSCPDKPVLLKLSHRVTDPQGSQGN